MTEFLKKLNHLLTRRDKQFLAGLFCLSLLVAVVETLGVSAIMPFIAVATDPSLVVNNAHYRTVFEWFGFASVSSFIVALGLALIGFYIFRGFLNLTFTWLLSRFSFGRYHLLAHRLFSTYLSLSYQEFTTRNSAKLNKTIIAEASNLTQLIYQALFLVSEIATTLMLYAFLIWINWKITLVLTVLLGVKVLILLKTVSPAISRLGEKRIRLQASFYETINDSLGNFKLIKLLGNEQELRDRFAKASHGYSQANISNQTLSVVPKYLLETIGFSTLIAVVVYVVWKYDSATAVIPIISMYALALYRMLPSANRIISSFNAILFFRASLEEVHSDLLYSPREDGSAPLHFARRISLRSVFFSFTPDHPVLMDVSLDITKGSRTGFVGESGSGKSTLVDVVAGIYKPVIGHIEIDEMALSDANVRSWRRKIGYIPQDIYLFDDTVARNVAFGHEYDEATVIEVLKRANIYDYLETHQGIQTRVGEGGILLSGGQKQRIGIARALYGDPEILILDEATSALDSETEARIMDEIYAATTGKTLLVIAHRLSTLSRCDAIYRVVEGRIELEGHEGGQRLQRADGKLKHCP